MRNKKCATTRFCYPVRLFSATSRVTNKTRRFSASSEWRPCNIASLEERCRAARTLQKDHHSDVICDGFSGAERK